MSLAALPPTGPHPDVPSDAGADLEQYAQTVAHELRSPLTAVLGFARMLRERHAERLGTEALQYIDRIEQAGRTMATLTNDLLDLAVAGNRSAPKERVDPLPVLAALRAELEPRLAERRTEISLPDAAPKLWCNRTQLRQVFANLLGNAVEHMGPVPQPRIAVSIDESPEAHRITVADNGRGIDASLHARIFEAYESFGPRRDGRGGTGIGLAIVRRIAEAHGGRAWVESRPGSGCAFNVLLPRP